MSSRTRTFLVFLVDINWLPLNRFDPGTPLYSSLGGIRKGLRQDHRKKNREHCGGREHNPVSLRSKSQMVSRVLLLSWLMPSFRTSPTKWSVYPSFRKMFHSASCSQRRGILRSRQKSWREVYSVQCTFLYLWQEEDHVRGSSVCAESTLGLT